MTRIACLMWYDKAIKEYADVNYSINKIYCEKHGFELIRSEKKNYTDKHHHPSWEKLPLVLETIEIYDYVVWIDADAHFYRDAPPITNIINEHKNKLFIFSKDSDYNFTKNSINAGVFIVKNSPTSLDFIKTWAYDKKLYDLNPHPYWWEQGVLRYMYEKNIQNIKSISSLVDFGILQHFNKKEFHLKTYPYIYHAAGHHKEYRIKISQDYFSRISDNNHTDIDYFTQLKNNKISLPSIVHPNPTIKISRKTNVNSSRKRVENNKNIHL